MALRRLLWLTTIALLLALAAILLSPSRRAAAPYDSSLIPFSFAYPDHPAAATWQRNADFVREFVEQGRDPRSLRVVGFELDSHVDTWNRPITSVEDAVARSVVTLEGRVTAVEYSVTAGSTSSIATVEVLRVVRGRVRGDSVEVLQGGGPTWSPEDGVLRQWSDDPLLMPGEHVVLLLIRLVEANGLVGTRFLALHYAGIYHVTPDGIEPQQGNPFALGIRGRNVDEVLALLK